MKQDNLTLIVPVMDVAVEKWRELLDSLELQEMQPERKLFADSGSDQEIIQLAEKNNFEIFYIENFNHGGTRRECLEMLSPDDIVIFITQDTIFAKPDSIRIVVECLLNNPGVSAAYGRQLPEASASKLEKYTRLFNYPEESLVKTANDIPKLGLRTAFCSNSFAAYRVSDLLESGGFPDTDFGEDMLAAAKLILNGKTVAYCAEATVIHSHNLSILDDFKRGTAIGKMHRNNPWLLREFGKAEKSGAGLAATTMKRCPFQFLFHGAAKYVGYLTGKLL